MRALTAATRTLVRDSLTNGALGIEMVDFVEAVTILIAHPLGACEPSGNAGHERDTALRIVSLLERSLGHEALVTEAAARLADDPPLLAAVFQNLDLLPAAGHRTADAIALLVVLSLSRLEEMRRE